MPTIAVVIIGRDAAGLLQNVQQRNLAVFSQAQRVVYVDSNSSDQSCRLAKANGWTVVKLDPGSVLSAAAGRHAGALHCQEDYILFLDADMELQIPSFEFLNRLDRLRAEGIAGASGSIVDIFPTGNRHTRHSPEPPMGDLLHFGGMLLIDRKALLSAGNWNPDVIAHEEDELYSRLRKSGRRLVRLPEMVCLHYTDQTSLVRSLIMNYIPLTAKERRVFPGIGMAFRSAWQAGSTIDLLKITPEPAITALAFAFILCLGCWNGWFSVIPLVPWMGFVITRRSLPYLAVCPAKTLQMMVGLFCYRRKPLLYNEM